MVFDWLFRKGHDRSNGPNVFSDRQDFENIESDKKIESFDIPVMDPFENIEGTSHDIFRHMEDMFNKMFSSSLNQFGSIMFDSNIPRDNDPRSLLLKDPDCKRCDQYPVVEPFEPTNPNELIDSDIDDEVSKHGLMLDKITPNYSMPKSFSYSKFSSMSTVRLPDGTLEERRKVTDNQGNIITTVRRSIGNQSYEVTTHSDRKGIKEKQENLTNLDENDVPNFEKRWQDLKKEKSQLFDKNEVPSILNSPQSKGDPSYVSLFKKYFG